MLTITYSYVNCVHTKQNRKVYLHMYFSDSGLVPLAFLKCEEKWLIAARILINTPVEKIKQYKNNQQNNKKPFKQTQCVDSVMYNNASNAPLLTRRIQLLCY